MTKAPKDLRIPIMMSSAEVEAIDEWRYRNKVATRAEAIRRLVRLGYGHSTDVIDLLAQIVDAGDRLNRANQGYMKSFHDPHKLFLLDPGLFVDAYRALVETATHAAEAVQAAEVVAKIKNQVIFLEEAKLKVREIKANQPQSKHEPS